MGKDLDESILLVGNGDISKFLLSVGSFLCSFRSLLGFVGFSLRRRSSGGLGDEEAEINLYILPAFRRLRGILISSVGLVQLGMLADRARM